MSGYRDDRAAAQHRIAALERELEALHEREDGPREGAVQPARGPHAVLSIAAGGALVGLAALQGSLVAAAVGLVIVVVAVGLLLIKRPTRAPAGRGERGHLPGAAAVPPAALRGAGTFTLPVSFVVGPEFEGIELSARRSRLDLYDDSAFFGFVAAIHNGGLAEIDSLAGRLELIVSPPASHEGEAKVVEVLQDYADPPLRPGDVHVFDLLVALDAAQLDALRTAESTLVEGRFTVHTVALGGSRDYPASSPIEVPLPSGGPGRLCLEFRERRRTESGSSEQLDLEIANVGTIEVRRLVVTERYYRNDGSHRDDSVVHQVTYKDRPIPPGETRLLRLRPTLPAGTVRWLPAVIELA